MTQSSGSSWLAGVTYDAASHRYWLNGGSIQSVTQVLSAVGITDFSTCPEYARERGTQVHKACEALHLGSLDVSRLAPEVAGRLEAWRLYLAESRVEIVECERPVLSKALGYVGRLDWIVRDAKGLMILDVKSGQPDDATGIQLAAYARAYSEETGAVVARRAAVHVREDGTYSLVPYTSPVDWAVFAAAVMVVNWRQQHGR